MFPRLRVLLFCRALTLGSIFFASFQIKQLHRAAERVAGAYIDLATYPLILGVYKEALDPI